MESAYRDLDTRLTGALRSCVNRWPRRFDCSWHELHPIPAVTREEPRLLYYGQTLLQEHGHQFVIAAAEGIPRGLGGPENELWFCILTLSEVAAAPLWTFSRTFRPSWNSQRAFQDAIGLGKVWRTYLEELASPALKTDSPIPSQIARIPEHIVRVS